MKAKPGIEEVVRVCEGERHAIECPNQRRINVVYANYGRLKGAHICGWFILSTNCGISTSMAVVRHDCQRKQHCDLVATNGKFGDDPCFLTHKYLEVSNVKADCTKVEIHFHPSHPQITMNDTSFCALVGLLLK